MTIPNSVTSIGEQAFSYCKSLTSVIIPNSVTSIGEQAFSYCTSLTSVTIPNSVTSIGDWAFYCCTSLTSVDIPNSVTSIGIYTFYDCTSLTSVTIPNSVTSIGRAAFSGCTSLTSVDIPNSVTSIGVDAFCGCTSLTSVTIPNSVTSIGKYAFFGCTSLTSVTIPNSVTSIEYRTFVNCGSLKSVTIPNSVTSIGYEAFSGCTSLTSVTIPNSVTSIGKYAFSYCASLTSVTIPASVTSIDTGAFSNCPNLTAYVEPRSYAEQYCKSNNVDYQTDHFSVSVPDDAKTFNGHRYQVFDIKGIDTWDAARTYCSERGGYLATITSEAENGFVFDKVLKPSGYSSAYFGLSDHLESGIWRWCNGEKVDYLNWSYGEPNDDNGNEHYAMFYSEYTGGYWNDGSFTESTGGQGHAFICEWGTYQTATPYYGQGDWQSNLFSGKATMYNANLARVAAEMSERVEDTTGSGIKSLFADYNLFAVEAHNFSSDGAFALARDVLTIDGEDVTVLVVVARGTQKERLKELIGDLFKGSTVTCLSQQVYRNIVDFEDDIWQQFMTWLEKYPINTPKIKVLVTGYSLGGAAANLLAAQLTQSIDNVSKLRYRLTKEDIYCYTFGSIKVIDQAENASEGYENIHNFYNYWDTFGPNGDFGYLGVSAPENKFGHTDLFMSSRLGGLDDHSMSTYKNSLNPSSGPTRQGCSTWKQ